MEISVLTIEIGSTITKVNGFHLQPQGSFIHLAQGFAPTSLAAGDVGLGVEQALDELQAGSGLQRPGG